MGKYQHAGAVIVQLRLPSYSPTNSIKAQKHSKVERTAIWSVFADLANIVHKGYLIKATYCKQVQRRHDCTIWAQRISSFIVKTTNVTHWLLACQNMKWKREPCPSMLCCCSNNNHFWCMQEAKCLTQNRLLQLVIPNTVLACGEIKTNLLVATTMSVLLLQLDCLITKISKDFCTNVNDLIIIIMKPSVKKFKIFFQQHSGKNVTFLLLYNRWLNKNVPLEKLHFV